MKQYLKELLSTPNEESLTKARYEEWRSWVVLKTAIQHLRNEDLQPREKVSLEKAIAYEEAYCKEAEKIKNEIAIILINKG